MANQTNNADTEIDLSEVSRRIKGALSRLNDRIFDFILFLKRNITIIAILFIAGVAIGYYLDKQSKIYSHKLYVYPNFESVDYLYSGIDHLNAKLNERDTAFFKTVGIPKSLIKLEVEPVIDIYRLVESDENRNYDVFRLMAENNDVAKVVEDDVTARNYKRHLITFITKDKTTKEKSVEPILKYLNSNPYFVNIKKEGIENIKKRIAITDSTLNQIDAILNDAANPMRKQGNLMYYNENTLLNEIIKIKNKLVKEQEQNRIELINAENIINEGGTLLNDKYTKGLSGKRKYIIPFIFILIFLLINRFRIYYRKQIQKRQAITS